MDDLSINPLRSLGSAQDLEANRVASTAAQISLDFQSLFNTLMFSNNPTGEMEGNSLGNDLVSPVLINLIEQLAALQITPAEVGENAPANINPSYTLLGGASATPWGAPLVGPLTQSYSPGHKGLDFGVPVGTEAHATMAGQVVFAGWSDQGYGNLVILENGSTQTYYAHLSQIGVLAGQNLPAGGVVGLTGNTGNSTGPHLHYEVRKNGQALDPTSFTLSRPG